MDRNEIIKIGWIGYAKPGASITPATRFWDDPSIH